MTEVLVEVDDLRFAYRRRPVLTGASWRVGAGVTALLGPNGAGKTTLIRCMAGLLRADGGDVRIAGRSIREGAPVQRRLGYVPQNPSLPSLARVRDVVAYAAWLSDVTGLEADRQVAWAMDAMDVRDLAHRRVRTLSGGQRQRVALATGIVHDPAVLILDEPTVGLDPGQRLKVREVIQSIGRERPVVLSTHMTEDVQHVATSVGVLVAGGIQYHGSVGGLGEVAHSSAEGRPGSAFERGYDDVMRSFGGSE